MGGEDGNTAKHPNDEHLIAFASGDLESDVARAAAAHVEGCAECAGTVARYRLVRDVLQVADAAMPPPLLVTQAKNLFGAAAYPTRTAPGLMEPVRRIVAQLIFDSGAGWSPALAGFRGGGERHLTYVAGAVQVDLRVQPPPDLGGAWRVQGQVDADELIPATAVDMVRAGENRAVARTTTDEHGMFNLAAPSGRYDILVRLPHVLQVLPGLELG